LNSPIAKKGGKGKSQRSSEGEKGRAGRKEREKGNMLTTLNSWPSSKEGADAPLSI